MILKNCKNRKDLLALFFKVVLVFPDMVSSAKKFHKIQGDSLTLPGTVLGQTPLLQASHTPQQQTCPSRRAQAYHSPHPDCKDYHHRKEKLLKTKNWR